MEDYKSAEQYTIKTQELLGFLDNFVPEEHEVFTFGGFDFQIIYLDEGDSDNNQDVFWSASTEIGGYDIYLLESLSDDEKKRRLFHELLEIDLIEQGISADESHPIVEAEEKKVFGERI